MQSITDLALGTLIFVGVMFGPWIIVGLIFKIIDESKNTGEK